MSGDIGRSVLPGESLHIVWNVGVDYPGFSSSTCRVRVTVSDGIRPDEWVSVVPGTFTMGSPEDEPGRWANEWLHQVTLTNGFRVLATEVTNQQYMEMAQWALDQGLVLVSSTSVADNVDGSTVELLDLDDQECEIFHEGGAFGCLFPDHPVKEVTWFGAAAFCDWLSLRSGLPRAYDHATWQCNGHDPYGAEGYRLPTEAEWEYACRAGTTTAFASGPITVPSDCEPLDVHLDEIGWYCGNSVSTTQPVAQKAPNAWGVYDMHGNIYEWCNDWWSSSFDGDEVDPVGPPTGERRFIRGGARSYVPRRCRSADRSNSYDPSISHFVFGFRPVKTGD